MIGNQFPKAGMGFDDGFFSSFDQVISLTAVSDKVFNCAD